MILSDHEKQRFLPIWIGRFEADAILSELESNPTPRPMTHELFRRTLETLGARVVRAAVIDIKEQTYYSTLTVSLNGVDHDIDARPSDAMALAIRFKAPIFAAEGVIRHSATHGPDGIFSY